MLGFWNRLQLAQWLLLSALSWFAPLCVLDIGQTVILVSSHVVFFQPHPPMHLVDYWWWVSVAVWSYIRLSSDREGDYFANLAKTEVLTKTSTSNVRTAPKTIQTVQSLILTCNVIFLTTPNILFVAFFSDGTLFACTDLSQSISRKSSRTNLCTSSLSKKKFSGFILIEIRRTDIETLKILFLSRRLSSIFSNSQIWQ